MTSSGCSIPKCSKRDFSRSVTGPRPSAARSTARIARSPIQKPEPSSPRCQPHPPGRTRYERKPGVIGHDDTALEADPAQDLSEHSVIRVSVRARDAESQSLRADAGLPLRLFDDGMKDLLDLQLSVRAQVRSAFPRTRHDATRRVRQQGPGLGAARVDPKDVPRLHEGFLYHFSGPNTFNVRRLVVSYF